MCWPTLGCHHERLVRPFACLPLGKAMDRIGMDAQCRSFSLDTTWYELHQRQFRNSHLDGWHGVHSRSPLRGQIDETKVSDELLDIPGTVRHVSRIDLVHLDLSDRPIFPFRCIGRRWMVRRGLGVEYSIRRCCRFHPMDDGCSSPSYLGSIGRPDRSILPFLFHHERTRYRKGGEHLPLPWIEESIYPNQPSIECGALLPLHRWNRTSLIDGMDSSRRTTPPPHPSQFTSAPQRDEWARSCGR